MNTISSNADTVRLKETPNSLFGGAVVNTVASQQKGAGFNS